MKEWMTVAEYAAATKRTQQSIYRSIKRGTLTTMTDESGVTLVSSEGLQPDVIPDTAPDVQPDVIPDESEQEPESGAMTPVYSQEYVDLLMSQIKSLQDDKEYLKHALAAALSLPAGTSKPDEYPVEQPDTVPDEHPVEPEKPKLSRWQHLIAFIKGE